MKRSRECAGRRIPSVTLTVLRSGEKKPLEIVLTRAVIRVESVKYERKGDVGYIRITLLFREDRIRA